MLGCVDDLLGRSDLDDPARLHDGNAVTDLRGNAQIVSNHQNREPQLVLQLAQEAEDLRLRGSIER
jgi:hypothetical protein